MSAEIQAPAPPPPTHDALTGDALTDALDAAGEFIGGAQHFAYAIADDKARCALEALIEAMQYLRLAATILGAEVGELNEVSL